MAQYYYGNASYFDSCPVGHDCCDNLQDVAYGYYWTDQSCSVLPQRGCDTQVGVLDLCTGDYKVRPLSTQCSCSAELGSCSGTTRCNGEVTGTSAPILDLKRDLFLLMHGSLDDGRVRFAVWT